MSWGVPLSVSYHFAFSYCSWGSQGKNTEVVCHSLLQWTTFCQASLPWPACLGLPHRALLSFIELDEAVVLVWLDWLVFCDYGFSVSALLQHLPSYLGFSYLGCGVSHHSCFSKAQLLLLTFDKGYLLTATPPDLEHMHYYNYSQMLNHVCILNYLIVSLRISRKMGWGLSKTLI